MHRHLLLFAATFCCLSGGPIFGKGHDVEDRYSGPIVLVDKNCIDGKYLLNPKETFLKPNDFPSIQDLVDSYNPSNYLSFIYEVLGRRYPTGKSIIEQAGGKAAVDGWFHSKETALSVLDGLNTAVHEIGHGLDKQSPENWYFISIDKDNITFSFTTPGMHGKGTYSGSPKNSMARSLILADDQNYQRPPCKSDNIFTSKEFGVGPFGCDDLFADIYLSGDPANNGFELGDQGYNSLIEEYTQYLNSLAISYYFVDYLHPGSNIHAMYTWMWWNERYLKKIRNEYPDQYQYLMNNKIWLELILTFWGRSWLYLSTGIEGYQPDTKYLHQLVQQEVVLSEIQRIRDAMNCENPVELLPDQVSTKILSRNRLSPFHAGSEIAYTIGAENSVSLILYDIKGNEVRTLFSGRQSAGSYSVPVSLSQFPKGVYVYRIQVGNDFSDAKKLIVH